MAQGFVEALNWVPKSRNLAATLARAFDYSKTQGHIAVTLEHLLLALISDPDASLVLHASNVDLARLNADVSTYLAGLQERQQTSLVGDPVAGEDLVRIVEYASAAAQQSRRREINGAIVLAAIVGDGRSAAASMLREQGLTFEEAIKALQRASAAANVRPPGGSAAPGSTGAGPTAQRTPAPPEPAYPAPAAGPAPSVAAPAPPPSTPDPRPVQAPAARPAPVQPPVEAAPPREVAPGNAPDGRSANHLNGATPESTEELLAAARRRLDAARAAAGPAASQAPRPAAPQPAPMQPDLPDHGRPHGPGDGSEGLGSASSLPHAHPAPPREGQPPDMPRLEIPRHPPGGAPAPRAPEAGPQARPASPPQPSWTPPPYPQHPAAPQTPPAPGAAPYGKQEPALPQWRPRPGAGPQPGGAPAPQPQPQPYGSRPADPRPMARPPWPEPPPPPDYAQNRRADFTFDDNIAGPPYPNPDELGPMPRAAQGRRSAAPAPGGQRPGAQFSAGHLVENIPRVMTAGVQEEVEVRIANSDILALSEGLQGSGAAYRHDVVVTKAMSVLLKAPDGGFWIETASPETQWIENTLGLMPDDFASWRWTVTPHRRGTAPLQLIVSARTVGADGMVAETALPDQIVDVKVRVNFGQMMSRWSGWIVAAVIGGVLAKFGEGVLAAGQLILRKMAGPG